MELVEEEVLKSKKLRVCEEKDRDKKSVLMGKVSLNSNFNLFY